MDKQKLIEFLKQYELCIIATTGTNATPEAAVMAFAAKDDGSLIMSTEESTRKYQNLLIGGKAALVVGGLKDDPCVQVNGEFEALEGEAGQEAKAYMLQVHPEWDGYFDSPTSKFFAIKPTWARYSDFSKNPAKVVEVTF